MTAPENAQELLPCPFCGSDCVGLKTGHHNWVWCGGCEACGSPSLNESEAIAAWNRRAPTDTMEKESLGSGVKSGLVFDSLSSQAPLPAPQNKAPQDAPSGEEIEFDDALADKPDYREPYYSDGYAAGHKAASDRWAQRVAELEERVFQAECKESMSYDLIAKLEARIGALREALLEIEDTRWSSEHVNPLKHIAREALALDDKERT